MAAPHRHEHVYLSVSANAAQYFPLREAGKAQIALETRETVGATVLVP